MRLNKIYSGDCLDVLDEFEEGCVDLIYLDPPFASDKEYEIIDRNSGFEERRFTDRWGKKGISAEEKMRIYISNMSLRLAQCHKILKKGGSFYIHCDHHANAYLRVELDKIFGMENFQREIIWDLGSPSGFKTRANNWIRGHDTILFYSKGKKKTFNKQYIPYTEEYLRQHPERREYPGIPLTDVWKGINSMQCQGVSAQERLGFPTQKPELLLEMIIKTSSNEGDLVLDPYCGSGTTLAVAERLGRNYIGIDQLPGAVEVAKNRLIAEVDYSKSTEVISTKLTAKEMYEMTGFDFQDLILRALNGIPNTKKVGDYGIDGWLKDGTPVQVKKHDVGRGDIDSFETTLRRDHKTIGVYVGLHFTHGADVEKARAWREDKIRIIFRVASHLGLEKEDLRKA